MHTIKSKEKPSMYRVVQVIKLRLRLSQIIVRKMAKNRTRYNQAPDLNTTWESDQNTIKHHIQESQEVSPFPGGNHNAAINRQENKTNTKHK